MRRTTPPRKMMNKPKKPKVAKVLPPKPTGGHGKFNVPLAKNNIVAKAKKVRKKI